ncbi:MAG: M1 family aminopeptidase [Candidatus Cloacimonas sp.]|nr:M1 family aminopeptidase [Candidatus Cloacimonas sp.]
MVIFFGIAFLVANVSGGAFDDIEMSAAKSGEFVFMNNPLNIAFAVNIILYFCTIVFAAIFGSSAVNDFENGSYEINFTKPVKPRTYYLGKLAGAYVSALSVAVATILGLAIGFQMPYLADFKVGPTMPLAYLHVLFYYTIPNLFVLGSVFFAAGLLSRKVINSYIFGIGFFFSYLLASALIQNVEKSLLAAILDPFGMNSLEEISRYWTSAQSNANYIPFSGVLLWNRLLWIGLAILVVIYTAYRFEFKTASSKKQKKQKASAPAPIIELDYFTKVRTQPYHSWKQFFPLCWQGFKDIVFNRTFLVLISFFSLFLVMFVAIGDNGVYGTKSYPLTSYVLMILEGSYLLFGLIISTFYAGDLLWREKSLNMDQLFDTTPHHSYVTYLSKLGAILLMQLSLLLTIMLVGIVYQLVIGDVRIELGLYVTELFIVQFLGLLPLTLMLFFLAIVMNNKYAGYLAIILFYVAVVSLPILNITHPLLTFFSGEAFYSEMNGYGVSLSRFFILKAYWVLFCLILTFIGFKFWDRGMDHSYRSKIKRIHKNGYDTGWKLATLSLAAFLLLGGFLYYNMNILNDYESPKSQIKLQENYEKDYKARLTALPQPSISEVHYSVDIHPSKRKMDLGGSYWLVNRNPEPIDTLVISYNAEYDIPKLSFSQTATLAHSYQDYGLRLYSLPQALAPQDSMRMEFSLQHAPKGIKSSGSGSDVMCNGTFVNNSVFPSFGYEEVWELSDNNQRKKKGLPPKPRMNAISDSSQYRNSYVNANSDYVRYSAEISTEEGQLAFAPGDLLTSWTKDGRYHASFGSTVPVLNFVAFVSGRYEKAAAKYQDKIIEIYYDKKHTFNIKSMLESATNSLKYYDDNFMPYPHKALRIVEVPYVYFAQSFPALIPFSENIGFTAKVDPESKTTVDYPYQVVAHEISHQWWAHTVIGANVQGCTLFSECFAEYSSLMVLKQKYGTERLRRQLNYVNDSYLTGRSNEYKEEQPLYLNENQGYLNYNKGTLVMNALQSYIGEEAVNKALGNFCRDYAYHSNPFPLSTDVLPYLENALPEQLKYLANDLFETITLYDNKIIATKRSYDDKTKEYTTTITFSTDKARYDGLGKKERIPVADLLDIALYDDKEEKRLAMDTINVSGGKQTLSLKSKEKPGKVILDPYFKMIDADRKNNIKTAG